MAPVSAVAPQNVAAVTLVGVAYRLRVAARDMMAAEKEKKKTFFFFFSL